MHLYSVANRLTQAEKGEEQDVGPLPYISLKAKHRPRFKATATIDLPQAPMKYSKPF